MNQGVVLDNGYIAYQQQDYTDQGTQRDAGNLFDASWSGWIDSVHGTDLGYDLVGDKFYIYRYKFQNSGVYVSKIKFRSAPSTQSTGIINIYYYDGSS